MGDFGGRRRGPFGDMYEHPRVRSSHRVHADAHSAPRSSCPANRPTTPRLAAASDGEPNEVFFAPTTRPCRRSRSRGLTLTLGEGPASVRPGEAPGTKRSGHGAADHWGIREGVPAVAEGTAPVRRTRTAAPGSRRPGDRLPVLRPRPTGASPTGDLAAPARHAPGSHPRGLRPGNGRGSTGDPRILGPHGSRHRRTPGPGRLPHRPPVLEGPRRVIDQRTPAHPLCRTLRHRSGPRQQPGHGLRRIPAVRRGGRLRPRRRPAGAAAVEVLKRLETDGIPGATSSTSWATRSSRLGRPCARSPAAAPRRRRRARP